MDKESTVIRVFRLHRVERKWLRRFFIVLTFPLLFVGNIFLLVLAYVKYIAIISAVFLFVKSISVHFPLFASSKHYWFTSKKIED